MIGEAKFTGWAVTVTYSDLRDGDETKQKHSNSENTRTVALRYTIKIPTVITKHLCTFKHGEVRRLHSTVSL